MRGARRDHWQAILGLGDAAIEDDGTFIINHFLNLGIELSRIITDQAEATIGFSKFYKIR